MDEENVKNKYVTEEYLDKRLDERFNEQTQVIIEAVDSILNKRLGEVNARADSRFEAASNRFDKIDNQLDDLKTDINSVQTLIDGYVKAQEDFKQEFVVMKEEFRQMKQIIKEKLGIEIRAI